MANLAQLVNSGNKYDKDYKVRNEGCSPWNGVMRLNKTNEPLQWRLMAMAHNKSIVCGYHMIESEGMVKMVFHIEYREESFNVKRRVVARHVMKRYDVEQMTEDFYSNFLSIFNARFPYTDMVKIHE